MAAGFSMLAIPLLGLFLLSATARRIDIAKVAADSFVQLDSKERRTSRDSTKDVLTPMTGSTTASKYEYKPLERLEPRGRLLMEVFAQAAVKRGTDHALVTPTQHSRTSAKNVTSYTFDLAYTDWYTYFSDVMHVASALLEIGLQPMDAVAIKGINSAEWFMSFMGTVAAGGLPVGMYPTDTEEALEYKSQDADTAIVFVGQEKDLRSFAHVASKSRHIKWIIAWGDALPAALEVKEFAKNCEILTWAEFISKGTAPNLDFPEMCCCPKQATNFGCRYTLASDELKKCPRISYNGRDVATTRRPNACDGQELGILTKQLEPALQERLNRAHPGQAGSVVYTSGTTGNAKGVMLSQDSLTWTVKRVADAVLLSTGFKGEDRLVSYLPLNHVAGQMLDIMVPIYLGSLQSNNLLVHFPSYCFVKYLCMPDYLRVVKPTVFLGVPEVWDKIKLKLKATIPPALFAGGMTDGMVKALSTKIKTKLGLTQTRVAASGAGAIKADTVGFFKSLNIRILNLFGQSESTAAGTMFTPNTFRMDKVGSIGQVCPETEIRFVETEMGNELQLRGRHVMLGYLNKEDKTKETIDKDGWLATGDVGEVDKEGFIWLTGRSKEIMKNHGGEIFAPVPAEQRIEKVCEGLVQNAIVVGDKERYFAALLMLPEELDGTAPTGKLAGSRAKSVHPGLATIVEARESVEYNKQLQACLSRYNKELAVNRAAHIWRYAILDHLIPSDDAEMRTPTQKLKRDKVIGRYISTYRGCYPCSIAIKNRAPCDDEEGDGQPFGQVLPCKPPVD